MDFYSSQIMPKKNVADETKLYNESHPLFFFHLLFHSSFIAFLFLFCIPLFPFLPPFHLFSIPIIRFPPPLHSFSISLLLSSLSSPMVPFSYLLFPYSIFVSLSPIFHFRFASYLFFPSYFLALLISLLLPCRSSMYIFLLLCLSYLTG